MNFYGDETRWFLARAQEPMNDATARIKIRILGLHSEQIPFEDLPLAKCILPSTEPGVSGKGKIPQIQNNALVFGLFLDGKLSQNPIILGSVTHLEEPSSVQFSQVSKTGRTNTTDRTFNSDGIIIDEDLVNLFDDGKSSVETREVIAMKYLLDNGISQTRAAAGVVGNLWAESDFDPEATGSVGERGIAQWNPQPGAQRLQMLISYANNHNPKLDPFNFFTQLRFLVYDMKNNKAHEVFSHLSRNDISFDHNPTNNIKNDTNSTYYFLEVYERPEDSESKLLERMGYANQAFILYDQSIQATKLAATGV